MRLSKVSYKSIQYSSIPSDSIISSDVKLNTSLNVIDLFNSDQLPENAKLTPIKHDIVEDIYNFIQPKKISRTPQYYNIYRLKRRKPFSIFGVKLQIISSIIQPFSVDCILILFTVSLQLRFILKIFILIVLVNSELSS